MTEGTPRSFLVRGLVSFVAVTLLMTTLLAHSPRVGAQQGTTVQLTPDFWLASTGQQFGIFVEAKDLRVRGEVPYDDDRDTVADRFERSDGLAAFEFTIQYDPAVLAVEGADEGTAVEDSGRGFQCLRRADEPGSISLGCFSPGSEPGLTEDLTLGIVTFLPVAPGSTYLELEAELAGPLGDDMPVGVEGGLVQVSGRGAKTATPPPGSAADGGTATPAPPGNGPDSGTQITPDPAGMATQTEAAETVRSAEGEGTPAQVEREAGEAADGSPDSESDSEAQNAGSSDDGGSSAWRITLWSLGAAGAVAAAVAVGFAAVRWQRQR